ncbi:MAG: DUF5004 domain-containing protein [Bacteroidales bacterium]
MRRLASVLMMGLMIFVALSCKKDKDESNTDKLTGKWWINTSMTIDPAVNLGGTLITDLWSQLPVCVKDDIQKFESDGVYTFDEGATKCSTNDPQTTTGTWSFNSDETILSVTTTGAGGTETLSYTIVSLDSDKMVGRFSEVADYGSGPLTYTYTITMVPK